ncbi:MAG: glycosyltransferase [Gammaproteobacteria bacterium]
MPRVSVILPTYNCGNYIGSALESEVIVVDDGSTDNTYDVISHWKNRLTYLYQDNRGPSAARNLAVSHATGEFLAYLDADDKWFPYKLEQQVAFLQLNLECGLVHSDVVVIDEADLVLFQRFDYENCRPLLQGHCARELLCSSSIHLSTVMERYGCNQEVGGFDERIRYGEDYLHWLKVVLEGRHALGYIEESLAQYRQRSGSLSNIENIQFVNAKSVRMIESLLTVYSTILESHYKKSILDSKAEKIVREKIFELMVGVTYGYRQLCRNDLARCQAVKLICNSPIAIRPYMELLKSYIPPSIKTLIRGHDGKRSNL